MTGSSWLPGSINSRGEAKENKDRHEGRRRRRPFRIWIELLCLAELADLITTHADRVRGGVEVNQVASATLAVGGPGLFWSVKLGLVAAMATLVALTVRYARARAGSRTGRAALGLVWRSLQLCVIALTVTAGSNLLVLQELVNSKAIHR